MWIGEIIAQVLEQGHKDIAYEKKNKEKNKIVLKMRKKIAKKGKQKKEFQAWHFSLGVTQGM